VQNLWCQEFLTFDARLSIPVIRKRGPSEKLLILPQAATAECIFCSTCGSAECIEHRCNVGRSLGNESTKALSFFTKAAVMTGKSSALVLSDGAHVCQPLTGCHRESDCPSRAGINRLEWLATSIGKSPLRNTSPDRRFFFCL
jgi:hypothetical protein